MKICPRDRFLVEAFLLREAEDFNITSRNYFAAAKEYLLALEKALARIKEKANFIVIESITNGGCTERVLKVTPVEWKPSGIVQCLLPPSPSRVFKIRYLRATYKRIG